MRAGDNQHYRRLAVFYIISFCAVDVTVVLPHTCSQVLLPQASMSIECLDRTRALRMNEIGVLPEAREQVVNHKASVSSCCSMSQRLLLCRLIQSKPSPDQSMAQMEGSEIEITLAEAGVTRRQNSIRLRNDRPGEVSQCAQMAAAQQVWRSIYHMLEA